jgi:hypothetical protein
VRAQTDDLLTHYTRKTAKIGYCLSFFRGEQKVIFEKALKYIRMFEDSKTYVREQDITDNVEQMHSGRNLPQDLRK